MRRLVGPVLAVVALAAAAVALLSALAVDDKQAVLTLSEVNGAVTVIGEQRRAEPGVAGVVLLPLDRVATGPASRAVLTLGDDTRIVMRPESKLEVLDQAAGTVTLELEGGGLNATVRPGTTALRIGSRGRQVLSTDGVFDMGLGEDGTLVVEMLEGSAMTSGFEGVSSQLGAGTRATVAPDGAAATAPISDELLLAVDWPAARRTREETTVVRGRTTPGAKVRVEGGSRPVEVLADREGAFSADVPLAEGKSDLRVEATDPLGRVTAVGGWTAEVDRRGPTFRGGVEYEKVP